MAKQDVNSLPESRRKRINRLKKIIIGTVIAAIVIPTVICICLGIRLHAVKKELANTLEEMSQLQADVREEKTIEDEVVVESQNMGAAPQYSGSGLNSDSTLTGTGNENANSSQDAETVDGKKRVYLTFDDGPSNNTDAILDILDKYQVKATFFVVGNTSDHGKEVLKRIVEDGHSIGVHSYSHKYGSIYDSEEAFFEDHQKIIDYIYETTGVKPDICRLPGGSSNTVSKIPMVDVVRALNEKDMACYDWNISGGDATGQRLSAKEISQKVLNGTKRFQTSVVLLHDGADKDSTVDALEIILKELTKEDDIILEKITKDTPVILHISI